MFSKILNSRAKTLSWAAVILFGSAFFSKLLGLLRNNLLGNLFKGGEVDVYLAAFRIPDLVYGILITGGIAAGFLPLFAKYVKQSRQKAEEFLSAALFSFLLILVVICGILLIFTPQIIELIVPGFNPVQKALTVSLTRIIFLSPILLGVSAIFSGVLHFLNLFFAYALAPIFYNLGIIFGIVFLRGSFGIFGAAYGVALGALAHLLIQFLPVLGRQFKISFPRTLRGAGLRELFKLTLPRVFGSAAYQINLIVITAIASTLGAGSIMVFNFSNDLYWVPIGLIGLPFATAAFPFLSRAWAQSKRANFLENLSSVFTRILFLAIPLSALIFILRAQIIRLFYGTRILGNGYFGWLETRLIAASVGIFAFSLFAAALIPFLCRVFFSMRNTKTPVKIAVVSMLLNIGLCFLFVWLLGFSNLFELGLKKILKLASLSDISVLGLVLSLSISSIFQFLLLCFSLKNKIADLDFKPIILNLKKIITASLLMAALTYLSLNLFALFFATNTVAGLFLQTSISAIIACSAYFLFCWLLKIKETKTILSLLYSLLFRQKHL